MRNIVKNVKSLCNVHLVAISALKVEIQTYVYLLMAKFVLSHSDINNFVFLHIWLNVSHGDCCKKLEKIDIIEKSDLFQVYVMSFIFRSNLNFKKQSSIFNKNLLM